MPALPCTYTDTTTKKPCSHLVLPGTAKCAAGHPTHHLLGSVPASAVAPATTFASLDLERLLMDMEVEASRGDDAVRGTAEADGLGWWLGEDVTYLDTLTGTRRSLRGRGTVPFRLDRLAIGDDVLAFGDYTHEDSLYLETTCRSYGCTDTAYVRLLGLGWPKVPKEGKDPRRGTTEQHRSDFGQSLAHTKRIRALCEPHRGGEKKLLIPPCPPVPGDRGIEYRQRDLHAEGVWPLRKGELPRLGGVTFGPAGHVLLVEPYNHYGGYAYTFPKGGMGFGENSVETALRETLEETGMMAAVIGHIPGRFQATIPAWRDKDGTLHKARPGSVNFYYLLRDSGARHPELMNYETAQCVWATPGEARELIAQTPYENGKLRDLAVLDAALHAYKQLGG